MGQYKLQRYLHNLAHLAYSAILLDTPPVRSYYSRDLRTKPPATRLLITTLEEFGCPGIEIESH
jgi:hypothetical protein